MTLFMGHFTIDMYGGMLPILFPILASQYGLDLATVGLISLAYSGMGSISQPIFGWLADRHGTRLTGAALIWTAVMFGAIGFAPSFTVQVIMAGAAGL
jgi:FSR family fosmidomycin resistance protein-like MFS transporter